MTEGYIQLLVDEKSGGKTPVPIVGPTTEGVGTIIHRPFGTAAQLLMMDVEAGRQVTRQEMCAARRRDVRMTPLQSSPEPWRQHPQLDIPAINKEMNRNN